VVAGGGVVLLELHPAAARRHHARPALREGVLALVDVPGAARAEARARVAEVVGAADREDVVVQVERVALHVAGLGAARLRAVGGGGGEAERVPPRPGTRPPEPPVPGDALNMVGGHVLWRPGLDDGSVARAHQLHLESRRRGTGEPERELHARARVYVRLRAAGAGLDA